MLLLHALLLFLLSISAMAAPVQGSDTESPKLLETKQIFHFYSGPLDNEASSSQSYMRKLHGFWQTRVVSEHSFFTLISCEPYILPCRNLGKRKL